MIKHEGYRRLFKNFSYISLIRIIEFTVPLITLPYLVRVLGIQKYGIIQVAYYSKAFFLIFTEFGFSLSAVRDIALLDRNDINHSLNNLISIKIVLLTIVTPIYWVTYHYFSVSNDFTLYLFNYLHLIVLTLNPFWFFKARQKVSQFAFIILIGNLVLIFSILLLIQSEKDYIIHIIAMFASQLIIVFVSFKKIIKDQSYQFRFATIKELKMGLHKYYEIFLATLISSSYTKLIPLILNYVIGEISVAIYVAAEKIIKAFENISSVIHESILPYFSIMIQRNTELLKSNLKKLTKFMFISQLFITLFIYFSSEFLVKLILGDKYLASIIVLKILSLLIFLKGIGHIALIQIMVNKIMNREVLLITICATVISFTTLAILMPNYEESGAAIAAVVPEIFVLLSSWIFIKKKKFI